MAQSITQTLARKLTANLLMLVNSSVEEQETILQDMISEAHQQYQGVNQDKALELIKMLSDHLIK